MSRKKFNKVHNNLDDPFIQRVLLAFEYTELADIARFYHKSPQNLNGMINRGTLIKLITPEMNKRNININWIKTGGGHMRLASNSADYPQSAAADAAKINEQPSSFVDKYRVVAEVGEILDSGNLDIIDALVKNVREFKRAVDMSKRLFVCEDELVVLKKEMADMRRELDRLTARPDGADQQDAGSEKKIM